MIRSAFSILLVLFLFRAEAESQKKVLQKKDLEKDWLIYSKNEYIPYNQTDKQTRTIYFLVNLQAFKGDFIRIESKADFAVFVNRQLLKQANGSLTIPIDSLLTQWNSNQIVMALTSENDITTRTLSTKIYSYLPDIGNAEDITLLRPPTFFKDFVITATLFLTIFLILMIQLNPRLSSDYFSVNKIFAFRENDDDQFYLRITSANILFYVFTSLMLGLFLVIVSKFTSVGSDSVILSASSFGGSLLAWANISLVIFALLFLKIVLLFLTSFLFDIKDAAGYHFFNFIRLILIVTTLLSTVIIGYYMLHGSDGDFYSFLFKSLSWVIGIWMVILFFKLSYRVRFTPIHLFSYICATEIIPFLIIVKILYE
jgi:hypothetical protein